MGTLFLRNLEPDRVFLGTHGRPMAEKYSKSLSCCYSDSKGFARAITVSSG